ncbi:response regulator [Sediminibacterium soli]|uniref:response regulator n=1 Tax=Sediminibacterium soli TaxID=2698829 RepID=UPI00137A6147|nr:response regulator [Sediminibacterium soli]NCI47979.1 response regulator [Sediminibacterium soli]
MITQQPVDVLLVEDDAFDAELIIREIKKHGVINNLVHLRDGEEALNFIFPEQETPERTKRVLPKLILLDIKMPKVNGFEVLERIKMDDQLRKIPIVILTSSKESPDISRGYALGANSYIVKPVSFDKFSATIKELGFYWLLVNQTESQYR